MHLRLRLHPRGDEMRTIKWLLLMTALVLGSGCAKTDWIDRTLVTVDVTGTWSGGETSPGGPYVVGDVLFELDQKGAVVKGVLRASRSGAGPLGGPIEGTVTGDVFRFRQTNGNVEGELTVSGDEMTGQMNFPISGHRPIRLQRIDPSSPPASPPR
jgi:hypothetical protein